MIGYCIKRRSGGNTEVSNQALLLISIYSLVVLARVMIRIPGGGGYGAGLLPVPLMLFIYMATAEFAIFAMPFDAERHRRQAVRLLLSVGLLATMGVLTFRLGQNAYTWLRTPRGNLRQPPSITLAMSQTLEFLARNSHAGDYVLALPEGSSLNFLGDRPAPLRYEVITPGFLSEAEEQRAIRTLQEKHVRYVLLLNRPTSEFGPRAIGRDYYRILMGWIEKNYVPVAIFGEQAPPEIQVGDPGFFIKCYQRPTFNLRAARFGKTTGKMPSIDDFAP
jgi:hypothetical protein